jgi:hypothetical protein
VLICSCEYSHACMLLSHGVVTLHLLTVPPHTNLDKYAFTSHQQVRVPTSACTMLSDNSADDQEPESTRERSRQIGQGD